MKIFILPFFLVSTFISPLTSSGQTVLNSVKQINYPDENWPSSGIVWNAAYDSTGFLWFGTGKKDWEVMRFDGQQFTSIVVPFLKDDALKTVDIQKTEEGAFYLLIEGETSHLFRMNPYTLKFDTVQFEGLNRQVLGLSRTFKENGRYYSIVQTQYDIGIFELHGDTAMRVVDLSLPEGTTISHFSGFIPYQNSFVLIADGLGVALFNWKGKLLQIFEKSNIKRFSVVSFKKKKYFMLKRTPVLYTFSPEKQKLVKTFDFSQQLGLSHFIFWNDGAGHLLLSVLSQSDLSIYRVSKNRLTNKRIIKGVNVTKWRHFFSKDASKSVWIANQANRITQFRFHSSPIRRFLEKEHPRRSVPVVIGHKGFL